MTQTPVEPIDYDKASSDLKRYLPLKVATFLVLCGYFVGDIYLIAATWNEWWPYPQIEVTSLDEVKPAIFSFCGGVLGATVFAFRGFYWAIGPQSSTNPRYRYDPNWTFWYLARPILGAILGVFVFGALLAGVSTLGTASFDTTGVASFFTVAFLAGFSVTEFLGWVTARAQRLFSGAGERRS